MTPDHNCRWCREQIMRSPHRSHTGFCSVRCRDWWQEAWHRRQNRHYRLSVLTRPDGTVLDQNTEAVEELHREITELEARLGLPRKG